MIHGFCAAGESQPNQLPKVEAPVGAAVNVTVVPLAKFALHELGLTQPSPGGELFTVPVPDPLKTTVRVGWFAVPMNPGHPGTVMLSTVATMLAVTMAPDEVRFPASLFVFTVAEIRLPPQTSMPAGDSKPVAVTVATSGTLEVQITWSVMSFCTGG